jgi:hypothetical protein
MALNGEVIALYAEALATISLAINIIMTIYLLKFKRRMEPLISKAFSLLGSLGSKERWKEEDLKKAEQMIAEGLVGKMPELQLLGSISPELLEYIKSNPELILGLYDRWAPLIEKFLKREKPQSVGV